MYSVVEKRVDGQGRLVLPREWVRELHGRGDVWVFVEGNELRIVPKSTKKPSDFYDLAKPLKKGVDPFKDWHGALAESSLR